ncbi:MAG: phosphomannose isomerase type II C-terminal cupin domain [bacterium]
MNNGTRVWNQKDVGYKEERPWGYFKILAVEKGYVVKEIYVNPNSIISLQHHEHRIEFWSVIEGDGFVLIGSDASEASVGHMFFIDKKTKHRLASGIKTHIKIIEVSLGEVIDENDIVRHEDEYGRE